MTTKHTPTPWELNDSKDIVQIYSTKVIHESRLPSNSDRANAAFIVKAVNERQGLIEALEGLLRGASQYNWDQARITLAKAKGDA